MFQKYDLHEKNQNNKSLGGPYTPTAPLTTNVKNNDGGQEGKRWRGLLLFLAPGNLNHRGIKMTMLTSIIICQHVRMDSSITLTLYHN